MAFLAAFNRANQDPLSPLRGYRINRVAMGSRAIAAMAIAAVGFQRRSSVRQECAAWGRRPW